MLLSRIGRIPIVASSSCSAACRSSSASSSSARAFVEIGIDLGVLPGVNGLWYLVIGLTAYNSVVIAEIIRAGVDSPAARAKAEAARRSG